MVCTCGRVEYVVEGERVEGIAQPDVTCPRHGRLNVWRAGDPLRRHALELDFDEEVVVERRGLPPLKFARRVRRLETPLEVETRLIGESGS